MNANIQKKLNQKLNQLETESFSNVAQQNASKHSYALIDFEEFILL